MFRRKRRYWRGFTRESRRKWLRRGSSKTLRPCGRWSPPTRICRSRPRRRQPRSEVGVPGSQVSHKRTGFSAIWPPTIGGHRHWSQCRRYPISDIWHWHLLFWYRRQICRTEKRHSDIRSVPISTSEFNPISEIEEKKSISPCRFEPTLLGLDSKHYNTNLLWLSVQHWMSDIAYRIKLYSHIRYNVGLRSLSPISEVPISGSVRYCWSRISDQVPTYAAHPFKTAKELKSKVAVWSNVSVRKIQTVCQKRHAVTLRHQEAAPHGESGQEAYHFL